MLFRSAWAGGPWLHEGVPEEGNHVVVRHRGAVAQRVHLVDPHVAEAIARLVEQFCGGEFTEEWDVHGLLEATRSYFPTRLGEADLRDAPGRDAIEQIVIDDALAVYADKEETVGADNLRDIERRVMLSVIDQHWREHLYEMDYLQEGINLRAMGQQDPLAEWKREGFDMFEAMMGLIEDDFVRYVFHLQVVVDEEPRQDLRNVSYSAPGEPVGGEQAILAAVAADPELSAGEAIGAGAPAVTQQPVRVEKAPGRNEPCPCGSGKKYKFCHGK